MYLLHIINVTTTVLLRLNQMLYYYALCLSYHSNTESAVLVCLSSGWVTITGRLLGPKVGNTIIDVQH